MGTPKNLLKGIKIQLLKGLGVVGSPKSHYRSQDPPSKGVFGDGDPFKMGKGLWGPPKMGWGWWRPPSPIHKDKTL